MFSKLNQCNNNIGEELHEAILLRINERRNKELVSAKKFFQGGPTKNLFELEYVSKSQVYKYIKEQTGKIRQGLKKPQLTGNTSDDVASTGSATLKEELESKIRKYACSGRIRNETYE